MKEDDAIDSMSMGMASNNHIEGVIPFSYLQIDNKRYLKYNISSLVSLSQYFNGIVNRNRVVSVMDSIATAALNAEEYMIEPEAFLWDKEHIFVDVAMAKAQMICMPVERTDTEKQAGYEQFFREMLLSIQFDQSENCDYVAKLLGFFNANPHFSLNSLSKVLNGIRYEAPSFRDSVPSSGTYAVQPGKKPEILKPISDLEQNSRVGKPVMQEMGSKNGNGSFSIPPATDGAGSGGMLIPGAPVKAVEERPKEKKKFSLFGKGKSKAEKTEEKENSKKEKENRKKEKKKKAFSPNGMKIPGQDNVYDVRTEASDFDKTEILGGDETEIADGPENASNAWLELISAAQPGAMPRIELNTGKAVMTIGRISADEERPDIAFPSAFKRIGRHHARIEHRGGDFYIMDLGSVNHTLLNGQILTPNQYYQLADGMELTLTAGKTVQYRVHL